jgi:hypothetical protein
MPERIQLQRAKGWVKPPDAVVVARPSKWGNPFRVVRAQSHRDGPFDMWAVTYPTDDRWLVRFDLVADARADAVDRYRRNVLDGDQSFVALLRAELAGHDLACWCPMDQPCHADVLLELANGGAA